MDFRAFLGLLDERSVPYRIERWRDSLAVVVATPGSRWVVEFMDAGGVEVERFTSDGTIRDEAAITELLADLQ